MNEEIVREVLEFRKNRKWEQFHNPKDLAISLSIEASELLENFQWKTSEEALDLKKEHIADELADVLIYAIYLADALDVRLEDVIRDKLAKNEQKYPIEKAYGRKDKYTDL
ncbi:NTP pyrophosphatase, house-cleaning of non-canonical NTPs [Cohnella sp. OV330]|uniref:nucleotide pyrophosphohydrolase n=1 Tax=Cohnella sp. OV330 TaxID=1855288 RepID=UPI0008E3A8D8|nr:nucleotide pyrophosphohydrolase [Cohnella sp. OV330]SFA75575.1 NTP pyrophosphatase, house-cleaning of non-canonical NTPs [Cohnella sp. OV330]